MAELDRLIQKHRANGLLIDTNLFLLLLIGATNENRISRFSRTDQFSRADFQMLVRLRSLFDFVVTTPHILTEVSNLARLSEPELTILRTRFREIVEKSKELYESSEILMAEKEFLRLGLTDAAIIAAARRPLLVLTEDLDLQVSLHNHGLDVVNFNHIRRF
jgi:predicted nucleic acid-binding protein